MLWVGGVVLGSVLSFGGIPISGYSSMESLVLLLHCTIHSVAPYCSRLQVKVFLSKALSVSSLDWSLPLFVLKSNPPYALVVSDSLQLLVVVVGTPSSFRTQCGTAY
jgi:hypothetical protein